MLESKIIQGRRISSLELAEIRELIEANPLWHRHRLSVALAQQWQWYLIGSGTGLDLACLVFGAAAWQCAPRDRWIGWSAEQRARGLPFIANNQRFVILPWVRVKQLASHILGQVAQRISQDWEQRYHHPLYLLETFVQSDRFRGHCYRAANWVRVGQTTGRTRQSRRHRDNAVHAPVKDVYLYGLGPDGRQHLCR